MANEESKPDVQRPESEPDVSSEALEGQTGTRRQFLGEVATQIGSAVVKNTAYGVVGAIAVESSNGGNWHQNEPHDKTMRRSVGAAMGIVAGNIIEARMKKKQESEPER